MSSYLLGIDLGSSAVKVCLVEAGTGCVVSAASEPPEEMEIVSPHPGWAEQDPELWWLNTVKAVRRVMKAAGVEADGVGALGISYQMHGLVMVDKNHHVLRPSIIWCDSRAVRIGEQVMATLDHHYVWNHLLNSPGNFTASKLVWVKQNEHDVYGRIHKVLLPGDYIAMKLCDDLTTTPSGLSEGIFWDYDRGQLAVPLLRHLGVNPALISEMKAVFSIQGKITGEAATALGLKAGTPLTYRSGDQPNNALSLNVLEPGEVAATAGTSGVIYVVVDKPVTDRQSRVNTFLHVNHQPGAPRFGVLLCVNGAGCMYSWLRRDLFHGGVSYNDMNELAAQAPVGCDGLTMLPFGNGAERMLGNCDLGASFHGPDFLRSQKTHMCRAVQEAVAFAMAYGLEVLRELGANPTTIRAGNANLFQSRVFCETFVEATGTALELFDADGARGAALGAGFGAGIYANLEQALRPIQRIQRIEPGSAIKPDVLNAYNRWKNILHTELDKHIKA